MSQELNTRGKFGELQIKKIKNPCTLKNVMKQICLMTQFYQLNIVFKEYLLLSFNKTTSKSTWMTTA